MCVNVCMHALSLCVNVCVVYVCMDINFYDYILYMQA